VCIAGFGATYHHQITAQFLADYDIAQILLVEVSNSLLVKFVRSNIINIVMLSVSS